MKWSCVKLGTVIKLYHGKATSYTNDISENILYMVQMALWDIITNRYLVML